MQGMVGVVGFYFILFSQWREMGEGYFIWPGSRGQMRASRDTRGLCSRHSFVRCCHGYEEKGMGWDGDGMIMSNYSPVLCSFTYKKKHPTFLSSNSQRH